MLVGLVAVAVLYLVVEIRQEDPRSANDREAGEAAGAASAETFKSKPKTREEVCVSVRASLGSKPMAQLTYDELQLLEFCK